MEAIKLGGRERIVRPGESVAAAVSAAWPGDIVSIERGLYTEHVVIDKPITLRGLGRPTLSGGNFGDVIRVKAPDVIIEGLIIRDSGPDLTAQNAGIYVEPGAHRVVIRDNVLAYTLFGMWLQGIKDIQVTNNLITGKRDFFSSQRGNGIQLYDTEGARIVNNDISFVRDGIYVDVSHHALFQDNKIHHLRYGTHYMNSYYNTWEGNESYLNRGGLALMEVRNQIVRNNRAWGNSDHGIMLRTLQDSVIENNVVAGNYKGFFIYDAEYNSIKNNLIIDNQIGVHLWAGSTPNQVERNDFIRNRDQIKYVGAKDEYWDGNYWNNYVGWDRNGDGVGDIPYEANDVVDRLTWKYPLMKLLLNSPSVQTLHLVAEQFPVLRAPSVVDRHPRMKPYHTDWRKWIGKKRDD